MRAAHFAHDGDVAASVGGGGVDGNCSRPSLREGGTGRWAGLEAEVEGACLGGVGGSRADGDSDNDHEDGDEGGDEADPEDDA